MLTLQWPIRILYHGITICKVGYLKPSKKSLASRNFFKKLTKISNIFESIFYNQFSDIKEIGSGIKIMLKKIYLLSQSSLNEMVVFKNVYIIYRNITNEFLNEV